MQIGIASLVRNLDSILISVCQLLALFVISTGVVKALLIFLRNSFLQPQMPAAFQSSRLEMGYAFSLGLSFLVGASILKTMISSRWDDITRLVVIIIVRTVLNLLLERAISKSHQSSNDDKQISHQPSQSQDGGRSQILTDNL
ncbi:MAG: DUF1622 domain-containing protein [Hydrococcus sp. RM1_1_31]|nr:DUF1622 domain-containing protein [Hydrococcus sp. RM1_1_31]